MKRPEYELGPLRAAVIQCKINIAAFERGIAKEKKRIEELQGHIQEWEKYNEWLEKNGDNI